MTTELTPFNLGASDVDVAKRLTNLVMVEYETSFQKFHCDARELYLVPGDRVVVESLRGPLIATVRGWVRRGVVPTKDLERVLRRATAQDEEQVERNRLSETDAYRFAIERINARKLQMKLVRAQWMVDGSKVVFYFSAEGRVDFRDLVKDLAHRFRTRIEMHQIGARDGTRMLGGIGACGRELCCSTFLDNFAPVSIRMAKDQGLTLNPVKVSGMCGRLMCCLVYEQQLYRSMRKRLPRANTRVRTRLGLGKVLDIDIINQRVNIELEDGSRKLLPVAEVMTGSNEDLDSFVDPGPGQPAYDWDEVFGAVAVEEPAASTSPKKSRRRRSRGRSKSGEGESKRPRGESKPKPQGEAKPKPQGEAKPKPDGADGQKPKSKRSRRKPKPKPKPE